MQKPSNYEETAVQGEWTPVELGGHYATIMNVMEQETKNGKPMIKVSIDFTAEDKQAGYFMKAFKADDRQDKKWPYNAVTYVMVYDWQDDSKTNKQFKSFCSSVEHSNEGFAIDWKATDWGKQFKGKKVGVVYGAEENEWNGNISQLHKIRWFCDYNKVEKQSMPKLKTLKGGSSASAPAQAPASSFGTSVPDDDLPF